MNRRFAFEKHLASEMSKFLLLNRVRQSLKAPAVGTRTFLDAAHKLVGFAFDELEVILEKAGEGLLNLAFGNVPISLRNQRTHDAFRLKLVFYPGGLLRGLIPFCRERATGRIAENHHKPSCLVR